MAMFKLKIRTSFILLAERRSPHIRYRERKFDEGVRLLKIMKLNYSAGSGLWCDALLYLGLYSHVVTSLEGVRPEQSALESLLLPPCVIPP